MDRNFTTASQLVVDMQRILRADPEAVAALEQDQKFIQFIFRCGGDCWRVLKTKAQLVAPDDFRSLFRCQDFVMEMINKKACLRPLGLKECDCGNDNLHIVDDVISS